MRLTEKTIISAILFVLITSFSLYGVWEDKAMLYAPLVMLIYAAAAIWAVGGWRGQESGVRSQRSEVRGRGSEVRSQRSDVPLPISDLRSPTSESRIPPGGILLLLFLLYSAVMIPFSVLPYEAKISTLRVGCYIAVYFAAANILSRFPRRKAVWITLFIALVFVALYSLVQHKVAPECILWSQRYTSEYGKGFDRLGGTYICPNHIAHLFQMWVPLCLVFLFLPQFGWFWRICFAYAIPLFLLLIYQTQSRAGILGTVTGVGVTILLLILRRSRKAFWLALVIVPLLGAGAVGGLYAGSSMFRMRMEPVVKVVSSFIKGDIEEAISVDFRPQTWADSMVMFMDRPITGFGPGNYGLTYPEYRQRVRANRALTVHPHNEVVELLTEYGLVGALLVLVLLLTVTVRLVRFILSSERPYHALPAVALLAALAGTFVHGFFDFELRIFPNALMLALLAGCAVAPLLARKTEDGGRKTEGGRRRTEDGGRKTEGGRRRTEDGGRRSRQTLGVGR
jgi:O-antigen ligase